MSTGIFLNYGQDKEFARLIADLKNLEDSLIAVCGDNLGFHCIGGFTENFSSSKKFFRYCLIDRETFAISPLVFGPTNYKSVQQLISDNFVIDGIKFESSLNSLKSFQVCSGLPPCLEHDLFEGVVANDLTLYIEYLVKAEKHFTYGQINRAVSQTKHLGNDSHNPPCEIKESAKKLSGSAVQNWCLL